jgi:Tfp pilus assembly protein PilN
MDAQIPDFTSASSILGFAFVTIVGICTFFIRSLIKKMEDGNLTLQSLDKNVAVLISRIDTYDKRMAELDAAIQRIQQAYFEMEKRHDDLRDIVSRIRWNCRMERAAGPDSPP